MDLTKFAIYAIQNYLIYLLNSELDTQIQIIVPERNFSTSVLYERRDIFIEFVAYIEVLEEETETYIPT